MSLIDQHRERDAQRIRLAREGNFTEWLTLQREHPLPPVTLRYLVDQLPETDRPRIIPFRGRVLIISHSGKEALLAWDHGHQSHDADVYRIQRSNAHTSGETVKASVRAIRGLRLKIFPEKRFDLSDVDRDDREALYLLAERLGLRMVIGRCSEQIPVAFSGEYRYISTAHEAFPRGSSNQAVKERWRLIRERWPQLHFKRSARPVEEL